MLHASSIQKSCRPYTTKLTKQRYALEISKASSRKRRSRNDPGLPATASVWLSVKAKPVQRLKHQRNTIAMPATQHLPPSPPSTSIWLRKHTPPKSLANVQSCPLVLCVRGDSMRRCNQTRNTTARFATCLFPRLGNSLHTKPRRNTSPNKLPRLPPARA